MSILKLFKWILLCSHIFFSTLLTSFVMPFCGLFAIHYCIDLFRFERCRFLQNTALGLDSNWYPTTTKTTTITMTTISIVFFFSLSLYRNFMYGPLASVFRFIVHSVGNKCWRCSLAGSFVQISWSLRISKWTSNAHNHRHRQVGFFTMHTPTQSTSNGLHIDAPIFYIVRTKKNV